MTRDRIIGQCNAADFVFVNHLVNTHTNSDDTIFTTLKHKQKLAILAYLGCWAYVIRNNRTTEFNYLHLALLLGIIIYTKYAKEATTKKHSFQELYNKRKALPLVYIPPTEA